MAGYGMYGRQPAPTVYKRGPMGTTSMRPPSPQRYASDIKPSTSDSISVQSYYNQAGKQPVEDREANMTPYESMSSRAARAVSGKPVAVAQKNRPKAKRTGNLPATHGFNRFQRMLNKQKADRDRFGLVKTLGAGDWNA